MKYSEKDIKLLWGRASGRCSYPSCNADLTVYLDSGDSTVIGEMAHIIARSRRGPRGSENMPRNKRNLYGNLILLCPNHHEMIDKAACNYSVDQILDWKKAHESRISKLNEDKKLHSKSELFDESLKILNENKTIHEMFGPSSQSAKRNPLSEIAKIWEFRKLSKVIPNNTQIIKLFENNSELISAEENRVFSLFREHAIALARNTYERLDREGVPTFPEEFRYMLEEGDINGEDSKFSTRS